MMATSPDFIESLQAAYACQSWFCRDRGPFLAKNLEAAEAGARGHRSRKWLGVWPHNVVTYRLDKEQLEAGKRLAEYMRRLSAGDPQAGEALKKPQTKPDFEDR